MTEDCFAPAIGHAPAFKTAASVTTVPEAERVFAEWFGAPVVLTSSGRAAISLYLGVTGRDRYRHRVAVPRMISACVLDAVIRHAFPVDAARQQAADTTSCSTTSMASCSRHARKGACWKILPLVLRVRFDRCTTMGGDRQSSACKNFFPFDHGRGARRSRR